MPPQPKDKLGHNPNNRRRRGITMTTQQVEALRARYVAKRKAAKQPPKRI